ncbi:hypothetical protein SH661x_001337 [Planctomicrobium sp. SH661]|uniref:hypothetical protein n=1 Tax=Planctomicrobium sp. SH661 TaxID=3448124 RepID=UPI003F5C7A0F
MDRRGFLGTVLSSGISAILLPQFARANATQDLKIAPFRFDVTPPIGHPLCGGWIKPATVIDDSLESIGFVLTGAGDPIVVCTVDWTGLLNSAHIRWREALAQAAGTSPERVAVQCVHQHNAPFVCLDSQKILDSVPQGPVNVQVEFFEECLKRGKAAVQQALTEMVPLTHLAVSQAKVEKVASNRRIGIDKDGKVSGWRGSSCRVPELRDLPEGLIDPWMKNISFFNNDRKVLSCYFYSTHPMSYYGDGRVNSDFTGLARKRRQADSPDCTHLYFTGCSGDVAAGKYNDGSPQARQELTDRIYTAMVECDSATSREPVSQVSWQAASMNFSPMESLNEEALMQQVANPAAAAINRVVPAMQVAWMRRCQQQIPVVLSALHINQATLLNLPGECFVEYQLRAQQTAPERFVATAAYGDGGTWYVPTREAFPQGGYEVSRAFSSALTDETLTAHSAALAQNRPS